MHYDVLVIGAGHAGCEAALAAARKGMRTCLVTMHLDSIAQMSCNPAIGGLAKGHLVREIDALGGMMALATDRSGIQFRMLNRSKGPAVHSLRAQADRVLYRQHMRDFVEAQPNLDVRQAMIERLVVQDGRITGVVDHLGVFLETGAVVVTTGTFLKGLVHVGMAHYEAGRAGEFPSVGLSDSLAALGLRMGRLKTGTPPRLDARSIDFSRTEPQHGDDPPIAFSFRTRSIDNPQLPCYMTYTNERTHRAILDNLDRSPLYAGAIKGIGPRYCPSIEDKVVRFSGRPRHQVFLEPEGLHTREYYANGISTSLPYDVQVQIVRSIEGCEEAVIMRPGYAIEYDFVIPTELDHTLQTKRVRGLYLAGQINGTSGYEEAAVQGLLAGANAALMLEGAAPLIAGRHEAYAGVLVDDLVTRGTNEPYRMFTSRAEYRLLLRHDNADMRLSRMARTAGLISAEDFERFEEKERRFNEEMLRLSTTRLTPSHTDASRELERLGTPALTDGVTLKQLLRRPELDYAFIDAFAPSEVLLDEDTKTLVQTEVKYEGYIERQRHSAQKLLRSEERQIPEGFDYRAVGGLSSELLGKLEEVRPRSLAQAGRIAGMTPAAMSLLLITLERDRRSADRGRTVDRGCDAVADE